MDRSVLLRNLRKHWNDGGWWRDVAVPFAVRTAFVQPYFRHVADDRGTDVMAEDWDTLVILDACRYDMFAETNPLAGDLQTRRSRGSNTAEFLRRNFEGRSFEDTVYVTANPQVNVNLDDPFYETISVWQRAWDDDLNTVLPETMVEATIEAHETYPKKRIISHFVQPHYPFVGELGQSLIDEQAGIEFSKRQATGEAAESDHYNVWDLLKRGVVDEAAIWDAYLENLELTFPHVERLLEEISGRTVVTADHGNLVGEVPEPFPIPVRMYGHPPGVYADALVTVPWLVVEADVRRDIVAGDASGTTEDTRDADGEDEEAEDRLRALGYLS
jgi:hypothetical protein